MLTSLFSFVLSFTLLWNSQAVLGQIENEGQSNGIRRDRIQAEIDRGGDILLSDARKKYENKDYWKSAIDLVVILDFYTDYSKLDEAIYLLGNCLYEMGMFEAANRVYRYLLQTFPKTHLLPRAMLGMQKVYYQQNKYQLSLKFYKALEAHYPGQEGIDEARYYAGQAYYHLKNYHLVPNIVTHIRKDSEFYPFGMYTGALANLKKKV
ncbi:tetratricopeptide repeat protein [candidate division KSB1 bacterium]|nr:tetratricopeptide repeat protein [candidate division KSB1 bacterium]NIS26416.1 tetratricopeptide repeat protein [candidate division KSB1 bacterium]NIT73175.1 tetratricopeptide repeat protein [candidate division KSB1 bacterium]NIU27102.1 tetratricopeptide repeat protein [candidate division KSB1 bacterium]NIU90072.1 tetratricopeptide repeat protein [candidate division KSB1 bacterium]